MVNEYEELEYLRGMNQEQSQVIVRLQRQLDEQHKLMAQYEAIAKCAVADMDRLLKGVRHEIY